MKRASESPYSGQRSMLQEKDNDLSGEMQKPSTCSYREPSMSADDIWEGLREIGGPPSEYSSSGISLTVWWHPVSSAVSYIISRVPEKCSLLPVPQRAWEKTRLLSLGSREEFPGLYIRTYFPITVPFHSLMRKPNIFQQKKKKKKNKPYLVTFLVVPPLCLMMISREHACIQV